MWLSVLVSAAHNTMVQRGMKAHGTVVSGGDSTITDHDLGTLVIIDDDDSEEMESTMKRRPSPDDHVTIA